MRLVAAGYGRRMPTLSRLMSAATASYAVFALVRPRHLGNVLRDDPAEQAEWDAVAQTYGARDLAVSAVALFGRSPATVRAAMAARILSDLGDGALLSTKAEDSATRAKVLAVTVGWAALNLAAVVADARRERG